MNITVMPLKDGTVERKEQNKWDWRKKRNSHGVY